MRGMKPSLAVASVSLMGLALWASTYVDRSGGEMATAAERFLAALDDGQKAQAAFSFDSPERLDWHFIPRTRKGLPVKAMNSAQRALAFGLLQSGLGDEGRLKATTIMSLEAVLREQEQGKGPVRDPELYFFSIFGTPSNKSRWGWRVEGHHLSLNFVLEEGKIVSATPAFFGANPAEIRQGPRSGLRTLADHEDRALRLLQALDDDQKKVAILSAQAPREIKSGTLNGDTGGLSSNAPSDPAEGLAFEKMNDEQRQMVRALIEAYAADMPDDVGHEWIAEIRKAGVEPIRFAWYGAADRNQPHAYKLQGPTFLIEFNNTQNDANHIHSLWRNMLGDFGVAMASK
jgi:Protein of unknown function (DUF3500)